MLGVAPSRYPEAAEYEGFGEIALRLTDSPRERRWYDFPCCVYAARTEIIEQYPEGLFRGWLPAGI